MNSKKNKTERLAHVARMYYEEEQTQGEIADKLGVSRPLVSRMLNEARRRGIVEIRVHSPNQEEDGLMAQLRSQFDIQGGRMVSEEANGRLMNQTLAQSVIQCVETLQPQSLGVGWGTVIGDITAALEKMSPITSAIQTVCPIIGNGGIFMRQYHTDENVRIIAKSMNAQPQFLYTPAFAENREEAELLRETSHYRAVSRIWNNLDMAIISVEDCPGALDLDPTAQRLHHDNAVGRAVAYYFDDEGEIVHADPDCSIHISLEQLAQCRYVLGICSSETSVQALAGALNTGLFTHLFARESLVRMILMNSTRQELCQ